MKKDTIHAVLFLILIIANITTLAFYREDSSDAFYAKSGRALQQYIDSLCQYGGMLDFSPNTPSVAVIKCNAAAPQPATASSTKK